MHNIRLYARLERVIAHSDEVEGLLGDAAYLILQRSRSRLAAHRRDGDHKVTQSKGRVDHFVNLEGPAALSVENGFHHAKTGEFVRGLNILKGSIV